MMGGGGGGYGAFGGMSPPLGAQGGSQMGMPSGPSPAPGHSSMGSFSGAPASPGGGMDPVRYFVRNPSSRRELTLAPSLFGAKAAAAASATAANDGGADGSSSCSASSLPASAVHVQLATQCLTRRLPLGRPSRLPFDELLPSTLLPLPTRHARLPCLLALRVQPATAVAVGRVDARSWSATVVWRWDGSSARCGRAVGRGGGRGRASEAGLGCWHAPSRFATRPQPDGEGGLRMHGDSRICSSGDDLDQSSYSFTLVT